MTRNPGDGDALNPDAAHRDQKLDRRAEAARQALRALIREYFGNRFGPGARDTTWPLDLTLSISPAESWSLRFDPPLLEQLLPQLERIEADWEGFRPGRAYCFRCQTATCAHGVPHSQMDVFQGYDEMGCPRWEEMTQVLLDLGDERVELLHEDPPKTVCLLMKGSELRSKQLASFGRASKTYDVLAQVAAGYFAVPRIGHTRPERISMTFQAVLTYSASGRARLRLNWLHTMDETLCDTIAARLSFIVKAQNQARTALQKLEASLGPGRDVPPGVLRRRAIDIMRKLARGLERGHRQHKRRTHHARERRHMERPVDMAMKDLRNTRRENAFVDTKTQALVFYGNKGRCHVFSRSGRHVTSFHITPDAVRLRMKKKRWLPMAAEDYRQFIGQFSSPGDAAAP